MLKKARRIFTFVIVAAMLCASCPTAALADGPSDFSDMPEEGYWSRAALAAAVENGLLSGWGDSLMPGESLTRAQMAAIINRAFGAVETASLAGFNDISPDAWYAADMAKAVQMKTFRGDGTNRLRPADAITRQEAFAVLARAFKFPEGDPAALNKFSDKADVAPWAVRPLAALAAAGYIQGDGGKLHPAASISREEFAQVMYSIVGGYISASGTYSDIAPGNIVVNTPGVTLKGLTVAGDLIIGDGVADGDVVLDNVTVTGRLVVRGGGENSIRLINKSNVGSISVGKTGSGGIRIMAEEGCRVDVVYVDDGVDDIILEGVFNNVSVDTPAPVVLKDASVTALTISTPASSVKLEGSTAVTVARIAESAAGASVEVGKGTKIARVESAAEAVSIKGEGTVTEALVSGNNTSVDTKGTNITLSEGTEGTTANGNEVVSGGASAGSGSSSGGNSHYAAEAATYAQLTAAMANGNVSSIKITGSIEIAGDTTLTLNKPVTVDKRQGALLTVFGTLINNSTFTGEEKIDVGDKGDDTVVQIMGGVFENKGTLINDGRIGGAGRFINSGTVTLNNWFHFFGFEIENSGTFNIAGGTLTLLSLGDTDPIFTEFTNSATGVINARGTAIVEIGAGCSLINEGRVTTEEECCIDNYGILTNNGVFTNNGFILNAGRIGGSAGITGGEIKTVLAVTSEGEFIAALSDLGAEYSGIYLLGEIEITEDMIIDKPVELNYSAKLAVPFGKTLIVTDDGAAPVEVLVKGELEILPGGKLITTTDDLEENEVLWGQVTVAGGKLTAAGGSSIENGGHILLLCGEVDIPEGVLTGRPWHDIFREMWAETFEDLKFALGEDRCQRVELTSSLTLEDNITLDKDMVIAEGVTLTVPSGKNINVAGGGSVKNLGTLAVSSGGTVINKGFIHIKGVLQNAGSFTNWEAGDWEPGILEAMGGGVIKNTGIFVNNGFMNVAGGVLENTSGRFTTYNTGGLFFSEGAVINSPAEFHNAGYMKIIDEYGDTVTRVDIENFSGLTNDSNWIDYTAAVYTDMGFTEAISAQAGKIAALAGDKDETGLAVYGRLDFAASMTLTGAKALEHFASYWVIGYWDGEREEQLPAILTVDSGATLTVTEGNTLFVAGGKIVNENMVIIEGGANIEIWVDGAFINDGGAVANEGRFIVQDEYIEGENGGEIQRPQITGAISDIMYSAKVLDWAGLDAAANRRADGDEKYYFRIEVRGESDIELEDDLIIDADVYVEWDSGILVPEGKSLTLTGIHEVDNSGDIWVLGTLTVESEYEFYNFGYVQAGGGGEDGTALFTNNGRFFNHNKVEVWRGGTFDNTGGDFDGDKLDAANGGTVLGITP